MDAFVDMAGYVVDVRVELEGRIPRASGERRAYCVHSAHEIRITRDKHLRSNSCRCTCNLGQLVSSRHAGGFHGWRIMPTMPVVGKGAVR